MAAGQHHDSGGVGAGAGVGVGGVGAGVGVGAGAGAGVGVGVGSVFEPARPASRGRLVCAFLLGALVWAAAGVLAIVLLGHSHILRTLVVAVLQIAIAVAGERRLDPRPPYACLLLPLYPLAYGTINALAATTAQTRGLLHGPRERRVVWDLPRDSTQP
ncbi:hypothetical protein [Streptomyces sp. N35]|uniref:hypothetical protein n=1 Tax=Streptomyces sp. N35 TaxID=2795730 RepID=UPI001F3C097F|nr:hypothetical protein [Streptomyces sp. N35]